MKCNSKRIQRIKAQNREEQRRKEREEFLNSLSEEERKEYLKNEEIRGRKALQSLAALRGMTSALGIKNYYQ